MSTAVRMDRTDAPPLALSPLWRRHLVALGLTAAAILLLFARDAADIARIWWTSSTFTHALLIPPIIAWLVTQRWPELRQLTPQAWAPGLLLVGAGAFGWLLGDASGVAVARHFGLAVMLQGAIVACLGRNVTRGLLFPIAYMLFMVPAGEQLVPPLQTVTARMCMVLLDLAGVPAHIEGVFITIPNGYFEVAEACSGVKFLVAMIAYGALAANVCFRSWPRRVLLMVAAVVAPVLANGLRAWGTIYIAHLTNESFAGSFDHVFYGWVFFAIVIALVMGAAWPFFDRAPADGWFDPRAIEPVPPSPQPPRALLRMGLAALAIAIAPIAWGTAIAAASRSPLPVDAALPDVPGWRKVAASGMLWRPRFAGADRLLMQGYEDGRGRRVDLAVTVYADQSEGKELVGFGQGAVDPASDWAWTEDRLDPPSGQAIGITAPGPVVREVLSFYRVGGVTTGSETQVKLETLKVRLLGGRRTAAAVLVSAEQPGRGVSARPAIDAFLAALGPIDRLADRLSGAQ